jgi:DNA-nicking Smr family endonuclease
MPDDDDIWQAVTAIVKPLKKKAVVTRVLTTEELAAKSMKFKSSPRQARVRSAYDAKIDLHGLTESAAHQAVLAFVKDCHQRGAQRLLVITGKSGALRINVPRWLDVPPLSYAISGIDAAPVSLGGEGACIVRLKKPR